MELKTKLTKKYKVIWTYGVREYDYLSEILAGDEFQFITTEIIYVNVTDCRAEVITRKRRWGMYIYTTSHEEAVKAAEYIAGKCPRCTEVCIPIEHDN